ncbi:MspA family porin [Williamsia sp. CHRR-6]|uniref:MspA family porin n=1 Tax=Williamsia sp. CHRR-6 TaxID=2835871 RepID=UPI001BDB54AD|nr:MspA family porin [Williamsia sp. CHRR-6]MBT0566596.1 MspA family porin [Williamsia sp. CHRR-6]
MSNSGLRRVVGAAAVAAVAAVGLASMGAGNAAAGPLPGGSKTTIGLDGTAVKITRSGEGIYPVPSVANNGVGRAAEISGNYFANVKGDAEGVFDVGYLIGCQVNISSLSLGGSTALNLTAGTFTLNGNVSIPLTPGTTTKVVLAEKSIKKGVSAVQFKRQDIQIQGCGGAAIARSFATVELRGDYYVQSTLYGTPVNF